MYWAALLLWGIMFLGPTPGQAQEGQPWSLEANAVMDYDFNASQQPNSPTAAAFVRGRGDFVYSNLAKVAYTLFYDKPYNIELKYNLFQNFHHRLSQYDVLSHTFTCTPSYSFGSTRLALPFNYNYTDVESDKYVTSYNLAPNAFYRFNDVIGLEAGMTLTRQYNATPVFLRQFDRTGRGIGANAAFYYFFDEKGGYVQARFTWEFYNATGRNNDGNNLHWILLAYYPVNQQFNVQVFADLGYLPYDHRYFDGSGTPYPKRTDTNLNLGLVATYNIYKGLDVSAHYYYTSQGSNIALYAYERHVVGVQVGYRY
jgi:hypothetical protein